MHVGCLFGTFDPPHKGHVAIAGHMLATQGLDEVWLVVTPQNPFKQDNLLSADHHRLAMVRLAVQGQEGLVPSDFELDLPKPNYTADSLGFMRRRWPQHDFDLIIGSDNLAVFHKWKDAEGILESHRLLVYPRKGFQDHFGVSVFNGHPGVRIVADAPLMPYSSTEVRAHLQRSNDPEDRVEPSVLAYIRQHGLYRS